MIDLCNTREASDLNRGDGCGSETSKRFPYHVTFIGCRAKYSTHEVQWLLIQMGRRKTAGIVDTRCCSPHATLNSFHAVQRCQLPYIRYAMRVTPFISE